MTEPTEPKPEQLPFALPLATSNKHPKGDKPYKASIVDADGRWIGMMTSEAQAEALVALANRAGEDARVAKLREALVWLLDSYEPPYPNCRCHISSPCNDCVEYGALREAITAARAILAETAPDAGKEKER